jgi:phthiocerol/phenolphthiocerol synthesis type-I polyketide synthase E
MASAFAEIELKLGPVHGVFHAAGLTSNERVMVQSSASAERVLRPKVQGSEVLAEILTGKPLDFLAFCSSISAIHPAPGGAAYAAANAFQDRFAIWCRQHLGIPAVSINLDTWRDVGMAAELYAPDEFAEVKRALMAKAMSLEEGVEAMERVLATGEPRMLISTFELAAVFADTEARLYAGGFAAGQKEPAKNPGSGLARTPETEAVMAIWRELLGAEWVAPDDNFFELGGHSLLGTMVLARIREQFGVALTIRAIFEAPTPELLAERIRQAEPVLEEEQAVGAGGEREEFEI